VKRLQIYADTSVFGGCHDEEFAEDSKRFFQLVRDRRIVLLVSDLIIDELNLAPKEVRDVLADLDPDSVERVDLNEEVFELRDAYLAAAVVGASSASDATHVAAATVVRADAIVSWNFRHLVRLDRMKAFNAVNLIEGYGVLTILSPKEVLPDESGPEEGV
jgi:predicted nucleic acid-binding protein